MKTEMKPLNEKIRTGVLNHLAPRFIDVKLTKKTADAKAAFIQSFVDDVKAIPEGDLEVLKRYGHLETFETLSTPSNLRLVEGKKKFIRDDGVEVTRNDYVVYNSPKSGVRPIKRITKAFSTNYGERAFGGSRSIYAKEHPNLRKLAVPASRYISIDTDSKPSWVSKKTVDLMIKWYQAAAVSDDANYGLFRALVSAISEAQKWGELVSLFPEAAELEKEFFTEGVPKSQALVTLNDDMKVALCQSMKSRKVQGSVICNA